MPKRYSARIILAALRRAGFLIISQKGSHIKLSKESSDRTLVVIVPNHKEIATGTFQSILKQAGMTREALEKYIK